MQQCFGNIERTISSIFRKVIWLFQKQQLLLKLTVISHLNKITVNSEIVNRQYCINWSNEIYLFCRLGTDILSASLKNHQLFYRYFFELNKFERISIFYNQSTWTGALRNYRCQVVKANRIYISNPLYCLTWYQATFCKRSFNVYSWYLFKDGWENKFLYSYKRSLCESLNIPLSENLLRLQTNRLSYPWKAEIIWKIIKNWL